MSRTSPTIDRRENAMLNAVMETNRLLSDQAIELAKNTTETRLLKEQVTTLNGKVAGHETRMQAQEGLTALMAQSIQTFQSREEKKEEKAELQTTFWQRNEDKIIWSVVAIGLMLFYYLLTNNGFPHFLSK
jgi:hypothetical protein